MKDFLALMNPTRWAILAGMAAVLLALAGGVAVKVHSSGVKSGEAGVRAEWFAADNAALRESMLEVARLTTVTNNLNEAYRVQTQTIDDLERSARADGVRVTKAQRDAAIAQGSAEAVRHYAGVAGDVYQACRDEYRALGYDAARGSATAATLKAWIDSYAPAKEFDNKLTTFTNTLKGNQ